MTTDAVGSAPSPTASNGESVRTVAWVHLQANPDGPRHAGETVRLLESALRRVQRTVRAGDRVCPFGTAQIGIEFGADVEAVSLRTLGERLLPRRRRRARLRPG